MAPNLGQKIALMSSLQEIGEFIACTVGISGLVNFNTLSEFLRAPRELPWQPNLNKNKPKLHRIHFCARNRELFRTNSIVFEIGEFKYAIQNFKGAKGVAMATKFSAKISQNCTNFSSVPEIEEFIA